MLMPRRVKHRKVMRGRMSGLAKGGHSVAFGDYGLTTLEPAWITSRQIEAARRAMTRSVRPWCLKRRTSLIRRIDNLWVGIGLPHWLNEKPVARLSCRPKRLAPPKKVLTIP